MSSASYPLPPTEYGEREKPAPDAAPVRRAVASRSSIALANLTPNNVGQVRMLNKSLFPVPYSEQVYQQILQEDVREVCKLGLYNEIPVGEVCCRIEDGADDAHCKVYIMMLGVLAPYRRLGIATALLNQVLEQAAPGTKMGERTVESIYLHVQTCNQVARSFYEQHGFVVTDTVQNYYSKLEPASAWLLEKRA